MPADFKLEDHGLTQAAGRAAQRRRLRVVRRGRAAVRASISAPTCWAISTACSRRRSGARARRPRLFAAAHPRQLEADAGEHQGSVSPGAAARVLRHVRPVAADQQSQMITDPLHSPRVHDLAAQPGGGSGEATQGVSTFRENLKLQDDRDPRRRHRAVVGRPDRLHDDDLSEAHRPAAGELAVDAAHRSARRRDASTSCGRTSATRATTPAMQRRRLRQANLFGPAGYVSADDGEAIECVQRGAEPHPAEARPTTRWTAPASAAPSTWSPSR